MALFEPANVVRRRAPAVQIGAERDGHGSPDDHALARLRLLEPDRDRFGGEVERGIDPLHPAMSHRAT